jgi:uncharacterized protein (DUF1330 family)
MRDLNYSMEEPTVTAYMIVNLNVADPVAYEEYKTKVPALIQKHGGKYLVRGGKFVVLEGEWRPTRLVLFEFPSIAAVQALFDDPEYQPLKTLRQRVSNTDAVVVEGL